MNPVAETAVVDESQVPGAAAQSVAAARRSASSRSFWIRQIIAWHWVSSGICLAGMLLFTITGITLNHAGAITATPQVARRTAIVPGPLRAALQSGANAAPKQPVPAGIAAWLQAEFDTRPIVDSAEWSETELYLSLPKPGGDAWIAVNRETGEARYENTDRGWISYLNDLHKGRHTGAGWLVFMDVLAGGCLLFTLTGLLLLQVHAAKRRSTWPLVTVGMFIPILLMLLLVHR